MNNNLFKLVIKRLTNIGISFIAITLILFFIINILMDKITDMHDFILFSDILKVVMIFVFILYMLLITKSIYDLVMLSKYKIVINNIEESAKIYSQSVYTTVSIGKFFERTDYKIGDLEIRGIGVNEITRKILELESYQHVNIYVDGTKVYILN